MKYLILSFTLVFYSAFVNAEVCDYKTNKIEILTIVDQIINDHIPELEDANATGRIVYTEFENDEYYLATMPTLKDIFLLKSKKRYKLKINTKLYDCAPSPQALKAILVHELKHLLDYEKASLGKFLRLLTKMTQRKGRSRYERQTDLYTLIMGYAVGLKAYRTWIYSQLDDKGLRDKKCFYYSPIEIDHWLMTQDDGMKTYFKQSCKKKRPH